jgi:hypothetical protein
VKEDEDQEERKTADGKVYIEATSGVSAVLKYAGEWTYIQRQLASPVRTPPSGGPATLAILNTAPTRPIYVGTLAGGTIKAMIV